MKEEEDVNMFGDIQSENEEDYVMPVYNENPRFDDSPAEQAEAEDEKFEETPQVMKPDLREFPHVQKSGDAPAIDEEDAEMEEEPATGDSPYIKTQIFSE